MSAPDIIPISDASDGTGATPGSDSSNHVRNDLYFMERLAERWAKDQGLARPGATYQLERLPSGYSGWGKTREGTKHVDRYVYGHPRGVFRSLNELFPHFKHLQEFGGSVGCQCVLCVGRSKGVKGTPAGFFPPQRAPKTKSKLSRFDPDSDSPTRGKQNDAEGVPDIYRTLLDRVKEAGDQGLGFEPFVDTLSPDWRAGHEMLQQLMADWSSQPTYIPRVGELVLFTRVLSPDEVIHWDPAAQALRRMDRESSTWLDRLRWEVGVVTQLPVEAVTEEHLLGIPKNQRQSLAYSGFRVEPLSEPGNPAKPWTSQHKYVPLHALRPFMCWKDCISGPAEEWHPTMKHAQTVASSLCVFGMYSIMGKYPHATLFARAIYLGPELILVGDAVRLLPQTPDAKQASVIDVMVVSSIRVRFVDLEEATDNDYDEGLPYKTCVHVCGKTYSLDPKRSFGGIGRSPVKKGQKGFPPGLYDYGTWFNIIDPSNNGAKLEVPFNRLLGKAFDYSAMQAWFSAPPTNTPSSSFQAVNSATGKPKKPSIQQGFQATCEAREYSAKHDGRIDKANGKSWFWAQTRIEQLDLHEINGRFVGVKDESRTKKQMHTWRQALKVVDGKRGGLEEYHLARKIRENEKRRESSNPQSTAWGMMANTRQADGGTETEKIEDGVLEVDEEQAMDVDDEDDDGDLGLERGEGEMKESHASPTSFHGVSDVDLMVIDD